MNKYTAVVFAAAILLLLLNNCQRRKLIKKEEPAPVGKVKIKRKFQSQNADFRYLNCKSKIEYTDGLQNFTSNANIRISKDSVIWVSVNPALGLEVVKCLINQDSVFIINRLEKKYYIFSFSELSSLLNFEVNYALIQSVLFGNPPFTEAEQDSCVADSIYLMLSQTRKNIQIENFVRQTTNKLEKIAMRDYITANTLEINYENFMPVDKILFAFVNKISLNYRNKRGFQNIYIGIEHHKLEPLPELKFPFNIPAKYERIK